MKINYLRVGAAVLLFASAALAEEAHGTSVAVEADALAFALKGYSAIVNVSLPNKFQVAVGTGRYDVPGFLLKGDDNHDRAGWKATVTSVQVLRAGYRFKGPMRSGPAVAAVLLNQNWKLSAEKLGGQTNFRQLGAGISGGYYIHIGKHFYIYPTVALTHNSVISGSTAVQGVSYNVAKYQVQESVHVGWEWGR